MEADFQRAFAAYMDAEKVRVSDAEYSGVMRFGLSNRERGMAFLEEFRQLTGLDVAGRRVLDVGSAYGGFVIAAAKAGARAFGIEIMDYLHALAVENARDEPEPMRFICGDFLDREARGKLGSDPFDIIILNDVFEHVFDLDHLCRCIAEVSHPGTVLYFAIPNGEAWTMVEKEGHRRVFALALLEPAAWPMALGYPSLKYLNVHYRTLETYRLYLRMIGLGHIALQYAPKKVEGTQSRVLEMMGNLRRLVDEGPFAEAEANAMARRRMKVLEQKAQRDAQSLDPLEFYFRYESHFWRGFASGRPLQPAESLVVHWISRPEGYLPDSESACSGK